MATATELKIEALTGEIKQLGEKVIELSGHITNLGGLTDRIAKESDYYGKRIRELEIQVAGNSKSLSWNERFILIGINAVLALVIFYLKG